MSDGAGTDTELQRENAELRARLAKAEETLKAIREGQVDAFVVHGSKGPMVGSLSSSETIYRRIVETMVEAALGVSTEGRIQFCNERFSELVGISPEDLLGRDLVPLVVPADREMLRGLLRECVTGRIKGRVEFCRPDGVPRPALLLGNALTEQGVCTLCLVAADLTELENATKLQAELRTSEERLRLATKATNDCIWDLDLVTGKIYWNERYGTLVDRPKDTDDSWQWWIDRIHPEDRDRTVSSLRSAIDGRSEMWTCAYRFQTDDGEWADILDRAYIARDDADQAQRVIGAMTDLSELKWVERQLADSEERLRLALTASSTGIWEWNIRTNAVSWSPEVYAVYGEQAGGFQQTAEDFLRRVHPDDRERVWGEAQRAIRNHSPYKAEYRILLPDGSIRWVCDSGNVLFDESNCPVRMVGTVTDSTSRKQAEVALRESEARSRLALESGGMGAFVWNLKTNHGTPDARTLALWGVTEQEWKGDPSLLFDRVLPEDRAIFHQDAADAINQKTPYHAEFRIRLADGTLRWLGGHGRIEYDPEGNPLLMRGVNFDITARKQAEQGLAHTTDILESLIATAPLGFCQLDRDLRFLRINDRMAGMNGIPATDHLGKTVGEIVPSLLPTLREVTDRIVATGLPVVGHEFSGETPADPGVTHFWSESWYPVRDNDGAITGFGAIVEDITERKRAEEALRRSEARLQSAIAVARLVPYEWNPQTGAIQWESQLKAMWGLPADAAIDYEVFAAGLHPADRDYVQAQVAKCVDPLGDGVYEAEFRVIGINDRIERWVSARGQTFFDAQRKPVHFVGAAQDITARKQADEQLRASEERLRRVLDSMYVFVGVLTPDGVMVECNSAPIHAAGQRREDVIGVHFADSFWWAYSAESSARIRADIARAASGEPVRYDAQVRVRDARGETAFIQVDFALTPLRDDAGRVTHLIPIGVDITPRKHAEEQVRASEQFNRSLMDGSADCVKVLDTDGRLLHMNVPGMCLMEIDDFSPLCGREWAALWPADSEGDVRRAVATAAGGEVYTFEAFCPTAKGTPKWWEVITSPVRESEGGRVVRLLSVSRDITARKRAEERQAFLLKLSDTLRAEPDADAVANRALRMLSEQLHLDRCYVGVYRPADDRADLTHQVGNDRVPPLPDQIRLSDFPKALRVAFDRTLVIDDFAVTEGLSDTDRRNIGALGLRALVAAGLREGEGSLLWTIVAVSATPRGWTRDEVTLIEEVTERTWAAVERAKAEAALQLSEVRFRTMANETPAIIWTADPAGNITFNNQRWLDYTGVDPADVQDWPRLVLHPDDFDRCMAAWEDALQTGANYEIEVRNRCRDGEYRWFLTRATPIRDAAGRVTEWYGSTTDIHDRKLAEEALREADRKKDEFLATLAHELRNPLAPIRNGLQIMKLVGNDAAAVEQSRAMMERQVEQMTRLIDDLMDVSRISRGKIELQKTRMSIADAIRNAVDISRPLIDARGHQLVVDAPPEPIYVHGDLTRLSQVFANLLNNAAKYTDKGGRIRVVVEGQGSDVLVRVSDNGVGIPGDLLSRVFEMFVQVDSSLEKSQGGLGIGLNIVKQLIEMHGGSIRAESGGLGQGSTFIVRLPVMLGDTAERPDSRNAPFRDAACWRILVVDDNVDGAKSLAMMLKLLGNDTHTAHNGEDGVSAAEAFRPDVILMDIGMPKLNGYEACRRIREQPWGQSVILVACTGWGQEEDKRLASDAGFDFHMTKPIDTARLETLLAERTQDARR